MHDFVKQCVSDCVLDRYRPISFWSGLLFYLKLYHTVHIDSTGCPRRYTIRERSKRVQQDQTGMRTTIQAERFDN